MPSELVHLALGGIVAVALLGEAYDRRTLAVVLAFAAVPDLDAFVGLVVTGAHRSLFHTLLFPALLGTLVYFDTRRSDSWLRDRFDGHGVRVAGVGVLALLFGGILPDMVTNGVNWLYPLQDQFVALTGHVLLSSQRGLVQTVVQFGTPHAGGAVVGTTHTLRYSTGLNPSPWGTTPGPVDRIVPVVDSGMQLLLVVLAAVLIVARDREARRRTEGKP